MLLKRMNLCELMGTSPRRLCGSHPGSTVRVVNPGTGKKLSLCEIKVNVLMQPATTGHYTRNAKAEGLALKHVLKLLAIAPEFHATNLHQARSVQRAQPAPQVAYGRKYKAVVVLFLQGGADSFNIVVPHSGCKRPTTAEDDASLKPRKLPGGQSCVTTEGCVPVKSVQSCEKYAGEVGQTYDVTGFAFNTLKRPAASKSRIISSTPLFKRR